MLLWIGLAVITAVTLAALLTPLLRTAPAAGTPDSLGEAGAIYRDQLREIDLDRERGVLSADEHRAARAEVARRSLAVADAAATVDDTSPHAAPAAPLHALAAGLALAVPLAAMLLYLQFGEPQLPAQPLAARLRSPAESARVDELIAAVELRLRQNPEDGQGWDVIAPVYLKQGRFRDAADAFARATRNLGESAKRLAGFAEATVLAHDGIVTEPARVAYEKLGKLEPQRPEPRFWLAFAKEQDGHLAAAIAEYDALMKTAAADAPWLPLVRERRDEAARRLAGGGKAPSAPSARPSEPAPAGPTAADIAAADSMSAADRQRMIEGMVAGLAERLRQNGRDLPGWERLIRAYSVMGRRDDAIAALKDARRNFSGEPTSLAALSNLARSLGLDT
jgi:cytochrome c-type biogenesis protein CcmH